MLATLLQYSFGFVQEEGKASHRAQPSGGGLYPIEMYPIVFSGTDECASGVYHYDVEAHALESLWERPFLETDIAEFFSYPWALKTSVALVMTSVFDRNKKKYGPRGYRQILIEAGHIGQNIYLVGESLGLKCCGFDGVNERALEKLLDVDGYSESVVYTILIG